MPKAFATLRNKPLVEAILEVKWSLKKTSSGFPVDPKYELLIGSLREALKARLPHYVRLPIAEVPGLSLPHQAHHQYRLESDGWPLVQLGPGVMTVNDTSGYESAKFLDLCNFAFSALLDIFKNIDDSTPPIEDVMLRYIDADELGGLQPTEFLGKLGVKVEFPAALGKIKVSTSAPEFVMKAGFDVSNPPGTLFLSFLTGLKEGKEALIWETTVHSSGDAAREFAKSPSVWLDAAYDRGHECFFEMIKGELYDRYK